MSIIHPAFDNTLGNLSRVGLSELKQKHGCYLTIPTSRQRTFLLLPWMSAFIENMAEAVFCPAIVYLKFLVLSCILKWSAFYLTASYNTIVPFSYNAILNALMAGSFTNPSNLTMYSTFTFRCAQRINVWNIFYVRIKDYY
jgi:hypothetical protein